MSNSRLCPREVTGEYTGAVVNIFVDLRLILIRADVMFGMPAAVMFGVSVDVLTVTALGLEFVLKSAYAFEALAGAMIASSLDIAAEVEANGSAGPTTALEVALPAPLPETLLCWSAPFICWPLPMLNCARALQACKPSCHV